jgi:hypothetical protein
MKIKKPAVPASYQYLAFLVIRIRINPGIGARYSTPTDSGIMTFPKVDWFTLNIDLLSHTRKSQMTDGKDRIRI